MVYGFILVELGDFILMMDVHYDMFGWICWPLLPCWLVWNFCSFSPYSWGKALACEKYIHNLYIGCAEDGKETTNTEAPENNPQYTTVYVGNLAPEASDHVHIF